MGTNFFQEKYPSPLTLGEVVLIIFQFPAWALDIYNFLILGHVLDRICAAIIYLICLICVERRCLLMDLDLI